MVFTELMSTNTFDKPSHVVTAAPFVLRKLKLALAGEACDTANAQFSGCLADAQTLRLAVRT